MYVKKIHQFLISTEEDAHKRKLVNFFSASLCTSRKSVTIETLTLKPKEDNDVERSRRGKSG